MKTRLSPRQRQTLRVLAQSEGYLPNATGTALAWAAEMRVLGNLARRRLARIEDGRWILTLRGRQLSARSLHAVRRLQGAVSRRDHRARDLFSVCTLWRRAIGKQFRGPRHQALRRAFGEGRPLSAAKARPLLQFAQDLVAAAHAHPEETRAAGLHPVSLRRVQRLAGALGRALADIPGRRQVLAVRHDAGVGSDTTEGRAAA